MLRILSTYLFVRRKLSPALLAKIAAARLTAVELFCARGHLDYRSAEAVRELAAALADHNLAVHAVHAPAERDLSPERESGAPLSICEPERIRRLEAVDEIKRTLDLAEEIPFGYLVQHLGSSHDTADPRRFDAAFNSLEHLRIFAKQRGVIIALENTPGELATPENLRHFITETRLTDLRLCFDIGHAHLADGVLPSLESMREFLVTTHIHDNHGDKDEHLLPYEGTIDWKAALAALRAARDPAAEGPERSPAAQAGPPVTGLPLVLELKEKPGQAEPEPPERALEAACGAFDRIEQDLEKIEPGA